MLLHIAFNKIIFTYHKKYMEFRRILLLFLAHFNLSSWPIF